jgi:hypothetical protein
VYDTELRGEKKSVVTSDGSKTLYSVGFGEAYHSERDGALRESLEKHVRSAFRFVGDREELTILDICFGLGFNTLATLYYLKQNSINKKVTIISPELDATLIASLKDFQYPDIFEEHITTLLC